MLPNLETFSQNEKLAWLRDNASNIKQGNYFRKFSQDELESKKDSLVDTCIDIDHKEEEFAEVKKSYGDELKAMKKNRADLTTSIKRNYLFQCQKRWLVKLLRRLKNFLK